MRRAVLLFSAVCMLYSCKQGETNQEIKKLPVTSPVTIDTTYIQDYVADIQSEQNVEIRSRIKGYLEAIHVDEGQKVKSGQILFTLAKQEFIEALSKAKSSLKNAVAEAKAAELDLSNLKSLVDKNVVSIAQLDIAQAKLDALSAKVEEAKAEEASALLNLSYTEIKAPFDGVINRIPNKKGSLIDEGTLLTSISGNDQMFAYFYVSEREYLDIITNKDLSKKTIRLQLANGRTYDQEGKIETVEGEFNKRTGSIAFRARFLNPDQLLKHGSSGKVRISNTIRNAMLIPQKSTMEIQDKLYIYVVNDSGNVKLRSITPGLRLQHLYVVDGGLSGNEKIIYEGIQNVKPDEKITTDFIPLNKIMRDLSRGEF